MMLDIDLNKEYIVLNNIIALDLPMLLPQIVDMSIEEHNNIQPEDEKNLLEVSFNF